MPYVLIPVKRKGEPRPHVVRVDFESRKRWPQKIHLRKASQGGFYAGVHWNGNSRQYHRLITDAPDSLEVDHINGDTLDNRGSNLRVCSRPENAQNARAKINSLTGIRGVMWDGRRNLYYVRKAVSGRFRHIGYFASLEEAAIAAAACDENNSMKEIK